MDKDLFNEKIKDAFNNFEENPPDYVLDRIKNSYRAKNNFFGKNKYGKGLLIASVAALLIIPAYFIFENESPDLKTEEITSSNQTVATTDNHKEVTIINEKVTDEKIADIKPSDVKNKESLRINAGEDKIVCGLETNLSASSDNSGTWNIVDENISSKVSFESPSSAGTIVTVDEPGIYNFRYTVNNNGFTGSDDVKIEFIDLSGISAGDDINTCELKCKINSGGSSGSWIYPEDAIFSSPENPVSSVIVKTPGRYVFVWRESKSGCSFSDTVLADFINPPDLELKQVNFPVCAGERIIIQGLYNSGYQSEWDFDKGNVIPENKSGNQRGELFSIIWKNNQSPVINLIVTNKSCFAKADLNITLGKSLKAKYNNSEPDLEIPAMVYFTNFTQFEGRDYNDIDNLDFEWNFGDGSSSSEANPDHMYLHAGLYNPVLIARTSDGCADTIRGRVINVKAGNTDSQSNIFSPNGDGENDVFKVNTDGLKSFKCVILTRSSEKIFEWSDTLSGWDGRIKGGGNASTGMYFYIIRGVSFDDKPVEIPGTVYLVRD